MQSRGRGGPGVAHASAGFTLAEVLVSLALATILIGIMGAVFLQAHKTYEVTDRRIRIFSDLRFLLERLESDLQNVQTDIVADGLNQEEYLFKIRKAVWDPPGSAVDPREPHADEIQFVTMQRSGSRGVPTWVWVYLDTNTNPQNPTLRQVRQTLQYDQTTPGLLVADGTAENRSIATGVRSFHIRYGRTQGNLDVYGEADDTAEADDNTFDGSLFYRRGTGAVSGGVLTPTGGQSLPTTLSPLQPVALWWEEGGTTHRGSYGFLGFQPPTSTTAALLDGAPDASLVNFHIPLLPSSVEIEFRFHVDPYDEALRRIIEIRRS